MPRTALYGVNAKPPRAGLRFVRCSYPDARARRNRQGARGARGAPARLGGALLRLRRDGASVQVRSPARPAAVPRILDRPRLPLGLASRAGRALDLLPGPAARDGLHALLR